MDSVVTVLCSHDRGRGGSDKSREGTKVISVDHGGIEWIDQRYKLGVGYLG